MNRLKHQTPDDSVDLYLQIVATVDPSAITRRQWRAICYGQDRLRVQQRLLDAARGARRGTVAEQLALYKAAHAVLPLSAADRPAFLSLLLAFPPVPLEWCDVLLEALITADTASLPNASLSTVRQILEALRQTGATISSPAEKRTWHSLLRQVYLTSYRPVWLMPALADP